MSTTSATSPINQFFKALGSYAPFAEIEKIMSHPDFDMNESQTPPFQYMTPLGVAASFGRGDVVKALLKKGALIHKPRSEYVLDAAHNGHFDVVSIILHECSPTNRAKIVGKLSYLVGNREVILKDNQVDESLLIEALKKEYFVNISQEKIIRKFKEWLDYQKEKFPEKYPHLNEYIDKFFSPKGYCNGLTWVFLYRTMQSHIEKNKNRIEDVWRDLRTISELEVDSKEANQAFEELFREITALQHPERLLHGYTQDIFFENIGDYYVKEIFSFSELLEKDDIVTYLSDFIRENVMIKLSIGGHVIGIIKLPSTSEREDNILFYDSNYPRGALTVSSVTKLAECIEESVKQNEKSSNPKIVFCMKQYILTTQKPIFEIKEYKEKSSEAISLLEKIYNSKLKKHSQNLQKYYKERSQLRPIHPMYECSSGGHSRVLLACNDGNTEQVKWYIEHNADLNQAGIRGDTPLYLAAQNGYADIVKILLDKMGEAYEPMIDIDVSPFEIAVQNGRMEVVKVFYSHVEKLDRGSPTSPSRLHKLFNRENRFKKTPLMRCCNSEQLDMIDYVIQHGANPNASYLNKLGVFENALIIAIKNNQPDVVRRLLRYSRKNLEQYREKVAQYRNENLTDTDLVEFPGKSDIALLDFPLERVTSIQGVSDKDDPLYFALAHGRKVIAEELIKAGADPNASLIIAIKEANKEVAEELMILGATLPQDDKAALLKLSIMKKDYTKVESLLKSVKTNASMFHVAMKNDDLPMVNLLVLFGKKPAGRTLGRLVRFAIEAKSRVLAQDLINKEYASYLNFCLETMVDPSPSNERFLMSINPVEMLKLAIKFKKTEWITLCLNEFSAEIDLDMMLKFANELLEKEKGDEKTKISQIIEILETASKKMSQSLTEPSKLTVEIEKSQLDTISDEPKEKTILTPPVKIESHEYQIKDAPQKAFLTMREQSKPEKPKDINPHQELTEEERFLDTVKQILKEAKSDDLEPTWNLLKNLNKELQSVKRTHEQNETIQNVSALFRIYLLKLRETEKEIPQDEKKKLIGRFIHLLQEILKPKQDARKTF